MIQSAIMTRAPANGRKQAYRGPRVMQEHKISGRPGASKAAGATGKPPEMDKLGALERVFGFREFLPDQEAIIDGILAGRDTFVVMPTGGGKSLCYQLPAHLLPGTCMVISPLISLMKDQVDAAVANGLRAAYVNSSQSAEERRSALDRLRRGDLDLIYLAPERLALDGFRDLLKGITLSLIAIDEAHCISEWGHDFRPDYLLLCDVVKTFSGVPVAAFTATATHRVQADIVEKLGLRQPHMVRASFDRPNLRYEVVVKDDVVAQILGFVRRQGDVSGIIYRTTRKDVEATAAMLSAEGVRALPYHAGLGPNERAQNQDLFNRDEVRVIVATIAFGMGIDKSNVRFVLHADLPKNVEGYYQETGRAGRDGAPALCRLYFGRGDIQKIRYFIDKAEDVAERHRLQQQLNEMVDYASLHVCRRRRLLAYFGETYVPVKCTGCDVCDGTVARDDATRDAQILLSAVARTGQRFGAAHVVEVVVGADSAKIKERGHDQLKTFGAGRGRDKKYWRQLIDQLMAQGHLRTSGDRFNTLALGDSAAAVLRGEEAFHILRQQESAVRTARDAMPACDAELFEALRVERRRIAEKQAVPPFVIFSDRTLAEIAARLPETADALRAISGVGESKLKYYGEMVLATVRQHLDAHPGMRGAARPPAVVAAPTARPRTSASDSLSETARRLRQGQSLPDIARERGMAVSTIAGHVEKLIEAGEVTDLGPLVSAGDLKRITALFTRMQTSRLAEIVEEGGGSISFEQARFVRAWLQRQDAAAGTPSKGK